MQTLSIKPRGRQTYPNQLSEVEPGAMVVAQNVVLDRDCVVEMRRGMKQYSTALTFGQTKRMNAFYDFLDTLIVHYDNKFAYDTDGAGTLADYSGTYSPPTGANVIRSAQSNGNIYFATAAGVKKLEAVAGSIASAGIPQALDGVGVTSGGSGWMTNNTQVAYRIVWGIEDTNKNLILGAPSQRIVTVNSSGGTRDVALTFTIPAGITTSHFYQVYRSVMSAGVAIDPNDELGLIYENNPTAGEITAKSITITDITPEGLRGATLYASPSQEGIEQSNYEPPLCRDICNFKNHTFYANTISKHRYFLTIISVGGTGLVVNDTVTIAGVTYTAKAAEAVASGQFLCETGLTAAENIDATAISLVKVINQYATNTSVYAYYISGYNDLPGQIMIEERTLGGAAFAITSSRSNAWNPVLPTSGTTESSTNSEGKNAIMVSKYLQPESVPLVNILYAGAADKNIIRLVALRESIFILKEDGIYRITGDTINNFAVSLFDDTVELLAQETAVPFNNQVFCMTNQGVVAVSETGVAIVSRAMERDFFERSVFTNFANSFAIPYESDRKFILFTLAAETDTFPTEAWVFNAITNAWTGPWPMNRSCGIIMRRDDKLYLGSWHQTEANARKIFQERKSFTVNDYADDEVVVSISAVSGTSITVASSTGISAGWKLKQGARTSIITAVPDGTHITVTDSLSWELSAATAYKPIEVDVEFIPDSAQNPGILKQFTDCTLFFEEAEFAALTVGFSSNFSTGAEEVTVESETEGPWGLFMWGGVSWGGGVPRLQPIRTFVPRNKQRCNWLNVHVSHSEALSKFALSGMSLIFEPMSERMK